MNDAADQVVLITGATAGIGKAAAILIARAGARVVAHGRSREKARAAAASIRKAAETERVEPVAFDLGALDEVRAGAARLLDRLDRLDVLVNNAGVYMNRHEFTVDGHETTFAVNHLAHFVLTGELLPLLEESAPARVVTVSSIAHTRGRIHFEDPMLQTSFGGYEAYAQSKLANVMFANELARRLSGTGVTSTSLHPGVINTKLLRKGFGMRGAPVEEGARTIVHAALSDDVEGDTGVYYSNCRVAPVANAAEDEDARERLWKLSAELCGLRFDLS